MKFLRLVPVALLSLMASCGGSGDAPAAEALCDGRDALRVRMSLEGGEPDTDGSYIRINHGFQALEIDGHCSYRMNAGWELNVPQFRDRGWRTGTLDPATAAALQNALPLANLKGFADCVSTGVIGAPARIIRTASSGAVCGGSGPRFDAAWAVIETTAAHLWPRSTPLDGAIRVSARQIAPLPGDREPYAWPLGTLTSVLQDSRATTPDIGHTLVTDPESTRKLRALRETYLLDRSQGEGGFSHWDGVTVTDGVITAVTFMRDALPYEDQVGRPPF